MNYTGKCTMELTEFMEEKIRDVFDLELEMLKGDREPLPDGRTRFTFEITDPQKGRMLVDFITMLGEMQTSRLSFLN